MQHPNDFGAVFELSGALPADCVRVTPTPSPRAALLERLEALKARSVLGLLNKQIMQEALDTLSALQPKPFPPLTHLLPIDNYVITTGDEPNYDSSKVNYYLSYKYAGRKGVAETLPQIAKVVEDNWISVAKRINDNFSINPPREWDLGSLPAGYRWDPLTHVERDRLCGQGFNVIYSHPGQGDAPRFIYGLTTRVAPSIAACVTHATWIHWMLGYIKHALHHTVIERRMFAHYVTDIFNRMMFELIENRFFHRLESPEIFSPEPGVLSVRVAAAFRFFNVEFIFDGYGEQTIVQLRTEREFLDFLLVPVKFETLFGPNAQRLEVENDVSAVIGIDV